MSVLNAMAINSPEFRSLRAFIILYSLMGLLILILLGFIYYKNEKEVMLAEHRLSMQLVNEAYYPEVHMFLDGKSSLEENIAYKTAIFDGDKKQIRSSLDAEQIKFDKVIYSEDGYIHFIVHLSKNALSGKYLVYETRDNELWLKEVYIKVLSYGLLVIVLMGVIGLYLLRLFLRPMRDSIALLDNFIKDTTHELNTPVSVIVTNIEGMQSDLMDEKMKKKVKRVDIAARTISNIYNDLTYLILNNKVSVQDKEINLSLFIHDRLEYFKAGIQQKKLVLICEIDDDVSILMDENKLGRLIDNILSNAIKYNRLNGEIRVVLQQGVLSVEDKGVGIAKDKLSSVFERYQRANDQVGGFGIGLHIVAMICKEYGIKLKLGSELNKGTKIELNWE